MEPQSPPCHTCANRNIQAAIMGRLSEFEETLADCLRKLDINTFSQLLLGDIKQIKEENTELKANMKKITEDLAKLLQDKEKSSSEDCLTKTDFPTRDDSLALEDPLQSVLITNTKKLLKLYLETQKEKSSILTLGFNKDSSKGKQELKSLLDDVKDVEVLNKIMDIVTTGELDVNKLSQAINLARPKSVLVLEDSKKKTEHEIP